MTVTVKNLVPAKQAENAQTTQYTAVLCKAIIDKFTATNTSGGNASITVNLIGGGGASVSNLIVTRTILPGEVYTFPELVGHVIEASGVISTLASASAALTIRVSGREIT